MPESGRTLLLDVTRLIARAWTGRHATGLDRVEHAYLRRYRSQALAVFQRHGVVKTLDAPRSDTLFDLLLADAPRSRARLLLAAPRLLMNSAPVETMNGLTYLNVGQTDFDLPQHFEWKARHSLKGVYFIHDLIPIRHPEYSRPYAINRCLGRVRSALRHADHIVVSTHVVAQDLQRFAKEEGLPEPNPNVAPLGVDSPPERPRPDSVLGAPYFLCIGTIEPRKNHALLLKVWQLLAASIGDRAPKLVIVGQPGPMTGGLLDTLETDPALRSLVIWRRNCADGELTELISGAEAVLFPSLAEGYGLPLIEALADGIPVIASDIPAFREIGQGQPTLLDPRDPEAWRKAITERLAPMAGNAVCAPTAPFLTPKWAEHFSILEGVIGPFRLKKKTNYGTSVLA